MKRLLVGVLAAIGVLASVAAPVYAADTNNYRIQSYDIQYQLSRDEEGRSRLKTIKRITAVFPDYDQNHGIQQAIPMVYDKHSTGVKVESVEREDGTPWEYSTLSENDNLVLRIGNASTFVHGEQTYIITYTEKDVTRHFNDTNSDEFYWDTVGSQVTAPIDNLTVMLAVDDKLERSLTGKTACYQGYFSQDNACELVQAANIFTTSATSLQPGENITIAVGFKSGTFTQYQPSLLERLFTVWIVSLFVLGAVAVGVMIWLHVRWLSWARRKKDVGAIVPEYVPLRDVSLATMADVIGKRGSAVFTAQLLDFAVRHFLKVNEIEKKSLFRRADYSVEIVQSVTGLKAEEQEILNDIFGGDTSVGRRLILSSLQDNTGVYNSIQDNEQKLTELTRGKYQLRARNPEQSGWFKHAGWILLILALVSLNPVMLIAAIDAFICAHTLWPLTDKGVALKRYAEGMKMYIHVAETERLRILQSPEGAVKQAAIDVNNPEQLVKLYERMLPYAVLFGEEKEWSKRIGDLYESTRMEPNWYSGQTTFNAIAFSSAMNTFNSSVSYSAHYESSSSSSFGGSSGGGFSGGGGGGGGTSGW